ncbi:MAG: hypothetical protein ACOC3V_04720 [bacterium]
MEEHIIENHREMTSLLTEVLCDLELCGFVKPPTYIKIKEFFDEQDNVPIVMQEQINRWKEIYE